ncbi:hypothetical protein [Cupriavidus campinensis]|uniref:Uncharacterized protein n=1 Tax=Cupriavidus campinensis TaxID=151783 RepID=A0ABY3EIN9_9BURK|nr:hypothetical protein [Cupriavidus campinensis]TSP10653.1 hypothetical protein FGG12_21415 [Cupriavidus campinensis]
MEHADAALYLRLRGNTDESQKETQLALRLEEEAATMLPCSQVSEPTRTILLRSAATLALRCNELERAERLAALALIGHGPQELKDEVRDVLEEIHFGRHMKVRGVHIGDGELQVSLSGQSVSFGMIQANQYLDRAKVIGNLLRRTAERVYGLPFQKHRGRSQGPVSVYMSAPRAASYAVTYRLGGFQESLDLTLGPPEVLSTLLDDIEAANDQDWAQLRQRIEDTAYLANFLALLKQLAPDGKDVSLVGFTSRYRGAFREVPFLRVRREIGVKLPGENRDEEVISGLLGAADRGTNMVKVGNQRIRVPAGLIDDIVRPLWGQVVRATVERRKGTTGRILRDVELVDE